MPKPILRVDLSNHSRDFSGAALNNLPLLDRANSNDRKLREALGRLAAQAEHQGAEVEFYVCDDEGRRPHDVICEPLNERELQFDGDLKSDLTLLEERLAEVEPEELRETLTRHLAALRQLDPERQACHFFKWKTPGGDWRLVWCWGV